MTQVIYNNKDITKDIDIKKCVICDRAGELADDASIVFPDSLKLWSKWNPQKGDKILIKNDFFDTGIMFVDSAIQSAGLFTITGISTPLSAKKTKNKIWRNVSLHQIIADIANNNGLKILMYNVQNYSYIAISQINQSDLEFLNNLCIKEGYCCKISDNNLIVFDEKYMESQEAKITISISDVMPDYSFTLCDLLLNSFTVLCNIPFGNFISSTYYDDSIIGGADRKVEFVSNLDQAQRWAKGYLRYRNKHKISAILTIRGITEIAAGSVINLKDFSAYDGKYYLFKVSFDTVNNKTILFLRQTINY